MSLSPATQHTQDQEIRRFHVGLLNIVRGNFRDFGRRRAPQFAKLSELFRAHWYRNFLIAPVFIELPRISTRRPEYSARRSSWNSRLFHNRNTFRSVLQRTDRAESFEMRDWSNHEIRFSGTLPCQARSSARFRNSIWNCTFVVATFVRLNLCKFLY